MRCLTVKPRNNLQNLTDQTFITMCFSTVCIPQQADVEKRKDESRKRRQRIVRWVPDLSEGTRHAQTFSCLLDIFLRCRHPGPALCQLINQSVDGSTGAGGRGRGKGQPLGEGGGGHCPLWRPCSSAPLMTVACPEHSNNTCPIDDEFFMAVA